MAFFTDFLILLIHPGNFNKDWGFVKSKTPRAPLLPLK